MPQTRINTGSFLEAAGAALRLASLAQDRLRGGGRSRNPPPKRGGGASGRGFFTVYAAQNDTRLRTFRYVFVNAANLGALRASYLT
jgi:hypothetical protein